MSEGGRGTEFARIEEMLRSHEGLKKAGAAMVDAFVQVARLVWAESSGTIEPRGAGHAGTYIPFSPIGTKRNLADSKPQAGKIRLAFKIPENLLPTVDPNGHAKSLQHQAARWESFNRTFVFERPEDATFVAELILACVLDRSKRTVPAAPSELEIPERASLDIRGGSQGWWEESERAFRQGFWRLCVILCTGIIEGRLRECLGSPASGDQPVTDLVDLLRTARGRGLLRVETAAECHALRKLPNCAVHPPRPSERPAEFTREAAQIAREVVVQCYGDLTSRRPGRA